MNRILQVVGISLIIGTAFGFYFYFTNLNRNVILIYNSILSSVSIGSLMMLFIYQRQVVLRGIRLESLRLLVMMLLLVIAAILGTELAHGLREVVLFHREFHFTNNQNIYFLNIIIVFVTGIPIYQQEVWKEHTQVRIQKQQFELLQLKQLQTQTELEMLRAKINPHFLYNVHNAIAGLIYAAPEQAEQMVLLLSKFFRFTLNKTSNTFHTVQEEVEISQTYLQLQQIRFGERLQTHWAMAPDCPNEQLPSFILQPLVENAVKYSVEQVPGPGKIAVCIYKDHDWLVLQVADEGPDFKEPLPYGFGLQSILDKLNLLYPDQYTFTLHHHPHKYVQIRLYSPAN
ncbi:sensor histidine kinase [Adhaeribacter radiodurans]|uniref:Histidine kinase n=1 Tax=Adhaeribacter radiodurans TaxID=2745197 RepID=A0A7L7L8D7_9BACT|nr:histidine kinase [Adhaeribacter radiodurans]QMU28805.1 histidine kinase [Adhaeribacter radiodurans]